MHLAPKFNITASPKIMDIAAKMAGTSLTRKALDRILELKAKGESRSSIGNMIAATHKRKNDRAHVGELERDLIWIDSSMYHHHCQNHNGVLQQRSVADKQGFIELIIGPEWTPKKLKTEECSNPRKCLRGDRDWIRLRSPSL